MKDLTMIENELVPVYETDTGEKVVNGRELHSVLQSKQDFSTWVKARLKECDALENSEYSRFHEKMEANNATLIEYIIKLDTAKEMAMLERNEKGKQVRRYFIQIEEKYQQAQGFDASSLSLQTQAIINLELRQNKIETKVDKVSDDLQAFKREMPILGVEESRITCAAKKKGVECLGGKKSAAYQDKSIRNKLYADIYRQLKREFGVTSYKAIKRNQCDHAVRIIENYRMPYIIEDRIKRLNDQMVMDN
jgi:anti-repressor protein